MNSREILLVYDRQCPVCEAYCRMVRIRQSAGTLRLVNARDAGAIMEDITARGLDIDQGMVLRTEGALYYGSDAIHALALMSSRSGVFNRLTYRVFGSKPVSRIVYPVLRLLRNLLLKLLGKTRINNLGVPGHDRF
jgi:predicted DCC family thiol-disulfide oxidoreductase YuxK